jgi:hypothetical protein
MKHYKYVHIDWIEGNWYDEILQIEDETGPYTTLSYLKSFYRHTNRNHNIYYIS